MCLQQGGKASSTLSILVVVVNPVSLPYIHDLKLEAFSLLSAEGFI